MLLILLFNNCGLSLKNSDLNALPQSSSISPSPNISPVPTPTPGVTPKPTPSPTPTPTPTPPVVTATGFFTDLVSAPVGAFVTAYAPSGGFGASGVVTLNGASQAIFSYSDTKVVFTVSGSGGALVVGTNSIGNISVIQGRVLTATTSTFKTTLQSIVAGDTIYLHAGTYSAVYDNLGWNSANINFWFGKTNGSVGTTAQPIAIIAYPNEVVNITHTNSGDPRANIQLGDGGGLHADNITIAGFNLTSEEQCIYGGGNTADSTTPNSGGQNVRIVGNTCTITDASSNTMTGLMEVSGNGGSVLGNTFHDPSNRTVINNNHVIYIQNGASNVEIAYNTIVNLHVGHVIQIHQDNTPMSYQNVNIHHNILQGSKNTDIRGINVGNVAASSTISIHDNSLTNLGQSFSAICVYGGIVSIMNNILTGIYVPSSGGGGAFLFENNGVVTQVTASGNSINTTAGAGVISTGGFPSGSTFNLSGNTYSGTAATSCSLCK